MPAIETITIAVFVATVVNRLVEHLVKPALVRYWPDYPADVVVPWIAILVAAGAVWWTDINLLPIITNPYAAKIFTILIVSGGANFIADITKPQEAYTLLSGEVGETAPEA